VQYSNIRTSAKGIWFQDLADGGDKKKAYPNPDKPRLSYVDVGLRANIEVRG
jgi:hypothetical protein